MTVPETDIRRSKTGPSRRFFADLVCDGGTNGHLEHEIRTVTQVFGKSCATVDVEQCRARQHQGATREKDSVMECKVQRQLSVSSAGSVPAAEGVVEIDDALEFVVSV